MDEKLKKFAQQLVETWKAFNKKKQFIIIGVAAAAIIVLIVVIATLNTTQYELLSSGLTTSEAGEVYSAVSAKNVAVKVSGTDIYVAKGTADAVRMELAEEGLPQGNLSYDMYSSGTNYAETDKDKQIKELQQTQNRLQNTIETIPGVTQAIVTIAQSNNDTYVLETDKTATTASVKLTLSSGTTLTKKQVNGIVSLVKTGVSGLTADNITVTDTDGNILNDDTDTGTDNTAEQLSMKSQYESVVRAKLTQMLNKVYGADNVNIVVNADLNFNSVSTVTNSYTSGVVNSYSESSEITASGSGVTTGAAGTSGAQPTYANSSGTSGNNYTAKWSKTVSMLNGSVQQAIKKNGGTLDKLTVAVLLNNYNPSAAGANTTALKQIIADAAGTNVSDISIQQLSFSSASSIISSGGNGFSFVFGNNILYAIVAAALLLIVLLSLLLVLLSQRKKKREQVEQEELLAAQGEGTVGEAGTVSVGTPKKPVEPVKSIEEQLEESQVNSLKKQIEDFTDKKPELVAQILKNWLKD